MSYITYAPIDRQFGCLERDLPPGAPFNGIDPLDGIAFGFALQSRYPLVPGDPDIRFGTVAKKPDDSAAILLRVITKAEYDAAEAAEMAARERATRPVPEAVTPAQAKTALYNAGLYDRAEAAVGNSQYALIRIWWNSAQEWKRSDPYIHAIAAELDLDDDAVDDLFRAAGRVAR